MPKSPQNYGQRVCLHCGDTFTATYPSQVVCSNECKYERRLERERERGREYRHHNSLPKLRRRIQALKNAVIRLSALAKRKPTVVVPVQQLQKDTAPQLQKDTAPQTPKRTYKKTCVVCGREFQAPYPNSQTCPKCIAKHSKPASVPHLYQDGWDD